MSYTEQQLAAIQADVGNVLVSAAAGSGKTKVLVERIMQAITREKDPVDIDKILIVTFTRNAANELKNRIADNIEQALEADPENERLQTQARNVHFAKISTIDSFCQTVVRRYFHKADIDPSFRLLDDSEGALIAEQSLDEVMAAAYERGDPVFADLVAAYGGVTGDGDLVKLIREIADKSESNPFPEAWLSAMLSRYEESVNADGGIYYSGIVAEFRKKLESVLPAVKLHLARIHEDYMPAVYEDAFAADLGYMQEIAETEDDGEFLRKLAEPAAWARLSTAKSDADPVWKENYKEARESYKKIVGKLSEKARKVTAEVIALQKECVPLLRCLCDLVQNYRNTRMEKQKEANAYDFSAIAHIALTILVGENGNPTEEAVSMSREFAEIMIDEYQDSNLLQERLLTAVASVKNGRENLFMVGDVKQSIYKFREACPELFLGKCDRYATDPAAGTRIDLQMNFRSNKKVIDSVNSVFARLMHKEVGGIDYDERAKLYYSGSYDGSGETDNPAYTSELLLLHAAENPVAEECTMIARKIRELTNPKTGLMVGGNKNPHRAGYGDVAVLFRSKSAISAPLLRTLRKAGIPATVADARGYYDAPEVDAVVSMLRLLDNPFQEIPMSVVLTSPAFGYTADDLAKLRLSARKNAEERRLPYTYTTLRKVAAEGADPALSGRAKTFLSVYDRLKKHAAYTDAAELIEEYLDLTKLREYCAAMPGGETAVRNLTQLISRARAYQASATGNLRAFLDYVENIKKWEIPVNDVSGDAGTNSVRLMTIHASKGMEFPIVILADTSHSFNTMDLQSTMVLHEELGFGPTLFFPKDHLKYGTLAGDAIRNRLQRDLYGEELRLLYVAMTRAEDKLIVTGRLGKKEKLSSQFSVGFHIDRDADRLPYAFVMRDTQSFLRLMLNAVLADVPEAVVARLCESAKNADEDSADTADWHFAIVNPAEPLLQTAKVTEQAEDSDWDARKQELTEYREFAYAARRADMPVKVSVSYLKKLAYLEKEAAEEARERADATVVYTADEQGAFRMQSAEPEVPTPTFAKEAEEPAARSGADFGTLCHRALQLHDYSLPDTEEACIAEWEEMARKRQILESDLPLLAPKRFVAFYESDLGKRMKKAYAANALFRERPFVMTIPANTVREDYPENATVLLQGVIDAYFTEDGEVVLVDYKTDRVDPANGEAELIRRYEKQLTLYAEAIERGTGLSVRERIIYSFALNKSIVIGYNSKQ